MRQLGRAKAFICWLLLLLLLLLLRVMLLLLPEESAQKHHPEQYRSYSLNSTACCCCLHHCCCCCHQVSQHPDIILDNATIKKLIGDKCDGVIGQLTEVGGARDLLHCIL
jgi:hypothetical protein